MGLIVWGLIGAVWGGSTGYVLGRLARRLSERNVERARDQFRRQREWLEARFLSAMASAEPLERLRWEDAEWRDGVLWVRDRQSRNLLALVGVLFAGGEFDDDPDLPRVRHATALFEYRRGRWHAEGKRIDEVRPDEAVRHRRFVPVLTAPRRKVTRGS